jgi:hypothetical protein
MDLHQISDTMPIKYEFDEPFEVSITERLDWEVQLPSEPGALVFYTHDGSRKDRSTGIGI